MGIFLNLFNNPLNNNPMVTLEGNNREEGVLSLCLRNIYVIITKAFHYPKPNLFLH